MLKILAIVLLLAALGAASLKSQDSLPVSREHYYYDLPLRTVTLLKTTYSGPRICFLALHDDENTGVEAAHMYCRQRGGSVTELEYGNMRNVSFGAKPLQLSFDPNQMFSEEGILASLQKYSFGKFEGATAGIVKGLANVALKFYNPDSLGYIVTLHNNMDGGFGVNSYTEGNYLFGVADSVYVNPEMDPDDLVLVTELSFFNYLRERNINAVLQNPLSTPDGSLSVYAQRNNIPYVNVEVQDGKLLEHLRLIELVDGMLKDLQLNDPYIVTR